VILTPKANQLPPPETQGQEIGGVVIVQTRSQERNRHAPNDSVSASPSLAETGCIDAAQPPEAEY